MKFYSRVVLSNDLNIRNKKIASKASSPSFIHAWDKKAPRELLLNPWQLHHYKALARNSRFLPQSLASLLSGTIYQGRAFWERHQITYFMAAHCNGGFSRRQIIYCSCLCWPSFALKSAAGCAQNVSLVSAITSHQISGSIKASR